MVSKTDKLYHCYLFVLFALISFLIAQDFAYSQELIGPRKNLFKIDKIQVRGIKKVEKEAVLEKINSKPGMMLDNYLLKKDIEKIYSMHYFDFVEAHQEGNDLIFQMQERPIITKISFEGNNDLDESDLQKQIKIKQYSILDVNAAKVDVSALQKYYEEKGFYLASIDYQVKEINKENIELIYKIREYQKVKVKKIIFLGNDAFNDDELKDIMETREDSVISFLSGAGNFKELNFQNDIERLKYFYKTKGHLQVNVGSPEITVSEDKRWVFITMKVNEGPKFTINKINFQGELLFSEEKMAEKMKLKALETYSEETLRLDIQTLTEMYQDEGYAFANVLRTLNIVPGKNMVDVDFSFEKGKIAYFGKIYVRGNTKTRDKVVRRELKIKEGARFSGTDLRISKDNVNRLGFFEQGSVVFNTVSAKDRDDVLDIEILVKERNTGQISVGAGYSTATKGFLQASIAQNNFRGLGQNLSFSLSLSGVENNYELSFTEPYFNDSLWTAGGKIYRTDKSRRTLSYEKKGFALMLGHPVAEYTRLFATYKFENTQIADINDVTINPAVENGLASSVRLAVVNDKRDNTFEPTNGHYISLSSEYVGLGGEMRWVKPEIDTRYYEKIWGDLVLRTRIYAAQLFQNGRQIPLNEKFTLGGSRNLRGYGFDAIGPKRRVKDNFGYDRVFNSGALDVGYGTIEFEHPLAREAGLKWVIFYDAGDAGVFSKFHLYQDYGFGLRWFSPIGVLRFEFGYPLNPEKQDSGSQFHFDIGQLF